jgi:purine-nucleoside phosphorylase
MALEELKVLGLKYAIGIGAYGSFSERLQIDDLVLADKAVVSDGTSKEYSTELYVDPSKRLMDLTEKVFRSEEYILKKSCVWTLDAMYRESDEKMKTWLKTGAECVNMETGTFYTVAKELDIEVIYFGFVLDLIHIEEWTGWGGLDSELKSKVDDKKSNLVIVEDLAVELARDIKKPLSTSGYPLWSRGIKVNLDNRHI